MSNENKADNENNKFWNKRRKIIISGLIFSSLLTISAKQDLKPLLSNPDIAKWYSMIIIADNIKWTILAILYIIYVTIHDISFEKIKALIDIRSKK
jgi:hypothetical protein